MKKILLILLLFCFSGLLNAQDTEADDVYKSLARKLYDEAIKAENLNNSTEAIKSLTQAVFLDADFAEAYLKLGELKIKNAMVAGAIDDLSKAITLRPNEKAFVLRSQAYLLKGDYQNSYNDLVKTLSPADFSNQDADKKQIIKDLSLELHHQAEIDLAGGKADAAFQKYNQIIIIDPSNVDAYFQKGIISFKKQDYSAALVPFERVVDLRPSNEAFYYRGASRYKLNNLNGAYDDISQALSGRKNLGIDGSDKIIKMMASDLLAQAVAERKNGNFATANQLLNKSALLNPEVAQVYFEKGLFDLKKNEYRLAIVNFNKANDLSASDEVLFYRGLAYLEANEVKDAFNDLSKFIKVQPTFIENREYNRILEKLGSALQNEALVLQRQSRNEEAIIAYSNLLQIQPNNAEAYKNRSNIYLNKKEYQKAIDDLDQLVRLQPSNEVYFLRGRCYLELNNVDAAVNDLVKTISGEGSWIAIPNSESVYDQLADILFKGAVQQYQKGVFSAARDKFAIVQLIKPDMVQANQYLGLISYKENQYRQAIVNFDKILSVQPSSEAYLYRAKSLLALKDLDGAFSDIGQIAVSELSSGSLHEYELTLAELANNFYDEATVFEKNGRIKEAQQRLNQVIRLKPDHAEAHFYTGQILLRQKQYLEAITAFNRAIELKPSREAYFGRGTAKSEINDLTGAFEDLSKARSFDTEKPGKVNNPQVTKQNTTSQTNIVAANTAEDLKAKFQAKITDADQYFNNKDYVNALTAYSEASLMDPSQEYPRNRIKEIEGYLVNQSNTPIQTKPANQQDVEELPVGDMAEASTNPASIELYNQGLERYYDSDLNGALEKFTEAIKLDSSFTDAYYNSGFIKLSQGYYEEAIADFDLVISIKPTDKTYFYKGRALLGLNKLKEAEAQFTNAINLNGQFFHAFNNRGNVKFQLGEYQGAIEDFTETINIKPDYVFAFNNRGNARFKLNDFNGAIADYNTAIDLRPDYGFAYLNRGIARELLGDLEGACADWKLAGELGIQIGKIYFEEQCETNE